MVIPSAKARKCRSNSYQPSAGAVSQLSARDTAVDNRAEGGYALFNQVAGDDPGRQEARRSDLLVGMGMG